MLTDQREIMGRRHYNRSDVYDLGQSRKVCKCDDSAELLSPPKFNGQVSYVNSFPDHGCFMSQLYTAS